MRSLLLAVFAAVAACGTSAQKISQPPERAHKLTPEQVAQEVRDYRMNNEDRIIRELSEFLAIPNVASDTENIQKNATQLVSMLEARGIETHLLSISGRGPVVFGKLSAPNARRTVIFYAHYDGQPVDPPPGPTENLSNLLYAPTHSKMAASAFRYPLTAPSIPPSTTMTGASTRALLPMTSPPSSPYSRRSTPCAPTKFHSA